MSNGIWHSKKINNFGSNLVRETRECVCVCETCEQQAPDERVSEWED